MKLNNPEIRFEVTNKCNARCIMCPREKMQRPQGIMDIALYERVLNEALNYGVKQVTLENYGESFMDPHIFERARYAKSRGLAVYTVTNASLIDHGKCEKVLELFDKIRISMYGFTRKTYENIHKGLCFDVVEANLERLFDMRRERNSDLKIDMYFLLLEENKREMADFLNKYGKLADAISVWKPHNWGDGRNYRKPDPKMKVSCGRPASGPVQVQWNGLVVPCCFDYDNAIVLGDLNKETLADVLAGDRYEALRSAHESGDFLQYPFCDACDQLHRRDDVLVYSSVKDVKVGATYAAHFELTTDK